MQQEERKSVLLRLLDGRVVDICTECGANAFLQAGSESTECLSQSLEQMSQICAKRRLNGKDKSDLLVMNLFFSEVSYFGSRDVFRQYVQQSTVKAWLDYVIQQIKRLTKDCNWITTGKLQTHDISILESSASMMYGHAVPVAFAFDSEFFNVLADMVKVRKGTGRALPSAEICHTITRIVFNAHNTSRAYFDNTWTTKTALKKLEATGVLEQFIRCATVPQPYDLDAEPSGLFLMFDELQACVPFISKKLQAGQPCGDVVIAILEGRDGSRVQRPSIINKLRTMIRFASLVDPEHKCDDERKDCHNCGKWDRIESLMKCSRCKDTYYCSKECQRADWKSHKKTCTPKTKKELDMWENIQHTVLAFCQDRYSHIMVKMVEACEQTGLSKNEMLVELNFMANEDGIVPTMQANPEFRIAPVKDYIEGSRPAEPNWFGKNGDRKDYESTILEVLSLIKEEHRKVQPDEILCLVNHDGGYFCGQVARPDPTTNKGQFSQDFFLAFKAYMKDDDDGPLLALFEPGYLQKLKRELGIHYGFGQRDASLIDPEHKCNDVNKVCLNCGKAENSEAFQKSFMKCGRCQHAYYCSKECQKADWKTHKNTCTPKTKKELAEN